MAFQTSGPGGGHAYFPLTSSDGADAVGRPTHPQSRQPASGGAWPPPNSAGSSSHNLGRASFDELRYSQENIERAVNAVPEWSDPETAINAAGNHIHNAIQSLRQNGLQKPIVVLVGEAHISHAATAVQMAAMKVLSADASSPGAHAPLLLVENPPSSIPQIQGFLDKVGKGEIKTPATVSDVFEGTPLRLSLLLAPPNPERKQQSVHHDRLLVKSAMALNAGFELRGFDKLSVNAKSMEEREEAMASGVREALSGGADTALLITGSNHVKALHRALGEDVHLITMSETQSLDDMSPRTRRSLGYALSAPDILNFRGSEELQVGMDLSGDAFRMQLLPRPW
jgi:hypothetical protein